MKNNKRGFAIYILIITIIIFIIGAGYIYYKSNEIITTPESPTNLNLLFKYEGNILDTFNGTYTKNMVMEKPIKINLKLSQNELKSIYQKITELDLFNKRPVNIISNMMITPCSGFYLKTEINSIQKEISWNNCNGKINEEFEQFTNYIIKIINSKTEYQNLPEVKGGYQ